MSDKRQDSTMDRWKVIKEFGKINGKGRGGKPFRPTKEIRIPPKFFENLEEFQSGNSFEQEDVPLILDDKKDKVVSSGGYRFYGTERNIYDVCRAKPPSIDAEKEEQIKDNKDSPIFTSPSASKEVKRGKEDITPSSAETPPEDDAVESSDYREDDYESYDEVYPPEPQKDMRKSTGFIADDDLRDAYRYDTTSSFRDWKSHAHAIPEYDNWTKREDFLKQGAARSGYDYERRDSRGLSIDLALYDHHPEFQSIIKTREYRKPGTIRNPFDYDDGSELKKESASGAKRQVGHMIPEVSEENRAKYNGNIQKPTRAFGRQSLKHKETPLLREDYEEENKLNEEIYQKRKETLLAREDYGKQNHLKEEKYRKPSDTPVLRDDYEEQNRLNEEKHRKASSRRISHEIPSHTQEKIHKYRDMAAQRSHQREFQPRMGGQSVPWDERMLSTNVAIHQSHPDDYGTSHHREHEEFTKKNGKQVYVKSQESFSHIHHFGNEE